ncbi:MAG: S1/P1 nuclease [Luteibaculaceae bacterium]
MKAFFITASLFLYSFFAMAWGPLGHYTIGLIAEKNMNLETVNKVERILDNQSISGVGVWMDNIRSDKGYAYSYTWHWVTTEDGKYDASIQEAKGDAYEACLRLIGELKKGGLYPKVEQDKLRMLIHIVADLHQPLHVGKPGDRGGNDVKVQWFGRGTNIHAVWDTDLIESRKMSYTELTRELQKQVTKELKSSYQSAGINDWLLEAVAMRPYIYDIPEDGKLGYEYIYQYRELAEERLLAAGLRLAKILEEIYGK